LGRFDLSFVIKRPSASPPISEVRQGRSASALAEAPEALMWPLLVVVDKPGIEIGLQLVDRAIDLFAERDTVEFVKQRAMEALADSIIRYVILGAFATRCPGCP
jgi:hypothetical protein